MFKQNVTMGPGTETFTGHTFEIFLMLLGTFLLGLWLGWLMWSKYKRMFTGLEAEYQSLEAMSSELKVENDNQRAAAAVYTEEKAQLAAHINVLSAENEYFKKRSTILEGDLAGEVAKTRRLEHELAAVSHSTNQAVAGPIEVFSTQSAADVADSDEVSVPVFFPENETTAFSASDDVPNTVSEDSMRIFEVEEEAEERAAAEIAEVIAPEMIAIVDSEEEAIVVELDPTPELEEETAAVETPILEIVQEQKVAESLVVEEGSIVPEVLMEQPVEVAEAITEEVAPDLPQEIVLELPEIEPTPAPQQELRVVRTVIRQPYMPTVTEGPTESLKPVIDVPFERKTTQSMIVRTVRMREEVSAIPTVEVTKPIDANVEKSIEPLEEAVLPFQPVTPTESLNEGVEEAKVLSEQHEEAAPIIFEGDDLLKIAGISPAAAQVLLKHGYTSYADLARTTVENLRTIISSEGLDVTLYDPQTWPAQSLLAENNEWENLRAYQKYLVGGKIPD